MGRNGGGLGAQRRRLSISGFVEGLEVMPTSDLQATKADASRVQSLADQGRTDPGFARRLQSMVDRREAGVKQNK